MIHFLKSIFFPQKVAQNSVCSICDESFSEKEITLFDDLPFCQVHYRNIQQDSWSEDMVIICTPENPELALKPQERKEELRLKGTLSYIKASYEEKDGLIYTTFRLIKNN